MPISSGKYVAPTWVNSTTPPIDADELQDICDSIESYADPVALVPSIPNPNILDNWYFVGGGSQQGGGQFPINQRGATSYTLSSATKTYTVDRWFSNTNGTSVVIESNYMRVVQTGTSQPRIAQTIERTSDLVGKTVTLSALCKGDGTNKPKILVYGASNQYMVAGTADAEWQVIVSTFTWESDMESVWFYATANNITKVNIQIAAIKLELGSTQTLAHQENGSWVLNEIPNFDIQYARSSELPSVPARYESGSYVGTGTSGTSNPSSLTFGFVPKLVTIRRATYEQYCLFNAIKGCSSIRVDVSNSSGIANLTWSGNTLQWYASNSSNQQNVSGATYYYTAIG